VRTIAGRSWMARVMGDTASTGTGAYAPANWMGVTEDDADPVAENEALPGEVTSGTMGRVQATFAHTEGAASYTLTRTLTADASVDLRKIGIFTGPSPGGTLVYETKLNDKAVMVEGDQTQITHTVYL
jgi:hypothetical protein